MTDITAKKRGRPPKQIAPTPSAATPKDIAARPTVVTPVIAAKAVVVPVPATPAVQPKPASAVQVAVVSAPVKPAETKPVEVKPVETKIAAPAPMPVVASEPAPAPAAVVPARKAKAVARAPKAKPFGKLAAPAATRRASPKRAAPKPLPVKIKTISVAAPKPAPAQKGYDIMLNTTETTKQAAEKVQALFVDANEKAKAAFEKSTKFGEEFAALTKGNVEALVESGKLAAKGAETLTQDAADFGKKSFEQASATFKNMAAAKSPTELFQLQSDYAKSSFDAAVAQASKVSEAWMKLAGDVFQPLSNRYAVAAEKIKSATR